MQKFKTSLPTNLPSAGYRAQPRHFSSTFASPSTVSPTQWRREYHGNANSKPMDLAAAMLSDTHEQIVGHADVERGTRLVAHHVNPIVVIARQN